MALVQTKLEKIYEGFFRYTSDDDATTGNYFGPVAHVLKKGDIILIQNTDGSLDGFGGVTAVTQRTSSALGTVTLSALI